MAQQSMNHSPMEESHHDVKDQIAELRLDLHNLEPEGIAGNILMCWVRPLQFVADPAFGVAETVIPVITSSVPFADALVGGSLDIVKTVAHTAHSVGVNAGVIHKNENTITTTVKPPTKIEAQHISKNEFVNTLNEKRSLLFTIIGFATSTFIDIISFLFEREKQKDWFQTLADLFSYLSMSGVMAKVMDSMVFNPTVLPNLIVLAKCQALTDRVDRIESGAPANLNDLLDGHHFMKFCTAAYGMSSIEATERQLETSSRGKEQRDENSKHQRLSFSSHHRRRQESSSLEEGQPLDQAILPDLYKVDDPLEKSIRASISEWIGVPEDFIVMFVNPGGSLDILRHFIAIDTNRKAVVLAIRGTFSVSETIIDLDADTEDFCGGFAHSGMAAQAKNIWSYAKDIVLKALAANPGYELVITGHSLGAGTAVLLNMYVQSEEEGLVPNNASRIRCFGFASPPVFTTTRKGTTAVQRAIDNCVCYIHDDDCVPFLSIANVLELLQKVKTVRDHEGLLCTLAVDVPKLLMGQLEVTKDDDLVQTIQDQEVTCLDGTTKGAERLYIPASRVIWMRGSSDDGYNNAYVHDPKNLPELFLDVDMLVDHFPPYYEQALQSLSNV